MDLEWKKGYCLDEKGNDQNSGVLNTSRTMSPTSCLNWCNQQDLATGCEYHIPTSGCSVHTYSVSSGSGHYGSLCSVILPKGLLPSSAPTAAFCLTHHTPNHTHLPTPNRTSREGYEICHVLNFRMFVNV